MLRSLRRCSLFVRAVVRIMRAHMRSSASYTPAGLRDIIPRGWGLQVVCWNCRHRTLLQVADLRRALETLPEGEGLRARLRCTECEATEPDLTPFQSDLTGHSGGNR